MLTDIQKDMLALAGQSFKYAGSLEDQARERFGLTPTRYWQEVNRLIRSPEAHAHSAALVRRLNQRLRPQPRLTHRLF